MKSTALFLVLGGMALLLVAATAFVGHHAQAEAPAQLGLMLYEKLDQTAVRRIRIARDGQQVELVRGSAGFWEVPAAGGYPANDVVKTLEEAIAGLRFDDRIVDREDGSVSDEALALYHLTAKSGMLVQLLDDHGKPLVDLIFGCAGPGRSGVMFRRADQTEILISFDSRLASLPVNPLPWVRLEMGLIDTSNMTIDLQRIGQSKITLVEYQRVWMVQGLKRGDKNELVEVEDAEVRQHIVDQVRSLACEGIYPAGTSDAGMDFDPTGTTVTCRTPDNSTRVELLFGSPRVLKGATLRDGATFDEPVVPIRVRIGMLDPNSVPEYINFFNRKAAERIFWIRQSTFNDFLVPRDKLVHPVGEKNQVDPALLNPLDPRNRRP